MKLLFLFLSLSLVCSSVMAQDLVPEPSLEHQNPVQETNNATELTTPTRIATPINSSDTPLESFICQAGSDHGYNLTFKLQRSIQYGQLEIKRAKATTNFTKDLSQFKGGRYRLDLNPRGGFEGYTLQYRKIETDNWSMAEGAIDCQESQATPAENTPLSL